MCAKATIFEGADDIFGRGRCLVSLCSDWDETE